MYDGLYTFVLRIANMALAMALGVLTARLLGPAGKGIYAMPMVQAGLVATAFGGLSSATSFFLLNRRAGCRILKPALITAAGLVVAAALAVLSIATLTHTLWAAPAAIVSLPASAAVCIILGYVAGVRRIRYATSLALVSTVVTLIFMACGLFLVARSPWVAILVWIVASSFVALVALLAMIAHARTLEHGDPVDIRAYLRMTLKVGATSLVTLLNYRADLYIVAVLLPTFDLGLYTVAVAGAESLLVPTQVAALVTSPHIGGLERAAAARLTARCVRNNLLAAATLCAIVFVFAQFVVKLLYGEAFLPLVPALQILLIGVVALSLGSPISSYYTLKLGKPEIPLVLAGISAAICIAIAIILVPHIGIAGAAFGSTAAYLIGQGLGIAYFLRHARVSVRDTLLPTLDDLRIYGDFGRRVFRDGMHLFAPRLNPTGKSVP